MERRQITFRGRVQGVGFRATARHVAGGFSVSGWVRNEADGTVFLEIQGPSEDIDAYLGTLRNRMGRLIAGEDTRTAAVVAGEHGFEVRR